MRWPAHSVAGHHRQFDRLEPARKRYPNRSRRQRHEEVGVLLGGKCVDHRGLVGDVLDEQACRPVVSADGDVQVEFQAAYSFHFR